MRQTEQRNSPYQPIDMSQWRQEVNIFVGEIQSELTEMIDELSTGFSAVGRHNFPDLSRKISQEDTVFTEQNKSHKTGSEVADNA